MPLLLAAAMTLATQTVSPDCGFASFSRAPARRGGREEVCVRGSPDRGQYEFQIKATDRNGRSRITTVSSRTCPATRRALQDMEALTPARPDIPGLGPDMSEITLDGVTYHLSTTATYGTRSASMSLSSNVGTPLARWADAMFTALENCQPRS